MAFTAEDWTAISNTIARYCHTNDFGDTKGWARCFTEDGLFEESMADKGVVTRLRGRKEIEEFGRMAREAVPHTAYARHWITNVMIEPKGESEATAVCFVKFVNTLDEGSVIVTGIYQDVLRKVGGEWLFAHRQAILDQTEAEAGARMEKLANDAKKAGKSYSAGTGAFSSEKGAGR